MHPTLPLIVAGNRDEFHARPTRDAHWWPDKPDILAGRDLTAGGTWLGLHRSGRFATVTNYRDADQPSAKLESRGHLITGFLEGRLDPLAHLESVDGDRYAGFNLLVADGDRFAYQSNRGAGVRELPPGIYAVANATLDTPWPKVARIKAALQALIDDDRVNETSLLDMLDDREPARATEIDAGDLPFKRARALSAPFVVMPDYGTRSSTVVVRDDTGRVRISEKRFGADGATNGRSDFSFETEPR